MTATHGIVWWPSEKEKKSLLLPTFKELSDNDIRNWVCLEHYRAHEGGMAIPDRFSGHSSS